MKLTVLNFTEGKVYHYSDVGEANHEEIETFLMDEGFRIKDVEWMVSDNIGDEYRVYSSNKEPRESSYDEMWSKAEDLLVELSSKGDRNGNLSLDEFYCEYYGDLSKSEKERIEKILNL